VNDFLASMTVRVITGHDLKISCLLNSFSFAVVGRIITDLVYQFVSTFFSSQQFRGWLAAPFRAGYFYQALDGYGVSHDEAIEKHVGVPVWVWAPTNSIYPRRENRSDIFPSNKRHESAVAHTGLFPLLNITLTDNTGADSQQLGRTHVGPRTFIVFEN
jgi:hypothetical protein